MWVSRRCVRKTYCQDDIWSGWPAALGHLSGLCLPGQIVARPTPVYTRIFSYYFSSNLFVVRLAKKVKYGIRKGFCRPSHPYFDKTTTNYQKPPETTLKLPKTIKKYQKQTHNYPKIKKTTKNYKKPPKNYPETMEN